MFSDLVRGYECNDCYLRIGFKKDSSQNGCSIDKAECGTTEKS